MSEVRIEPSWRKVLDKEFEKPYWEALSSFVKEEYVSKKVYQPPAYLFRAFELCPFEEVKVVVVGQDPYHNPGQANGLSFAVNRGISLPPSLKNIFKEIQSDLGVEPEPSGDLSRWARQGVLMLNSVLTVLANSPASHKGKGWEVFTDAVIESLNQNKEHVVYMLWGNYAKEKGRVVDKKMNLVLTSGHPSPYSAQFFFGNHHFSRCNDYLKEHGKEPIDWR